MNHLQIKVLLNAFIVLLISLPGTVAARGSDIPLSRFEAATAAVQAQIDSGLLAGATVLVAQNGETKLLRAMGYQDLENRLPMQTDTIFRIFSMTKPIAGTALMMLYDEGRFQLSDPVEKYIPQFVGLQVAKADGPDGNPDHRTSRAQDDDP